MHEPVRYDTGYKYDGDLEEGQPILDPDAMPTEQLYYDRGVLLSDQYKFYNTTRILSTYYSLKNSYEENEIILRLVSQYGITENDYYNIMRV